jgi:hypothetical protein
LRYPIGEVQPATKIRLQGVEITELGRERERDGWADAGTLRRHSEADAIYTGAQFATRRCDTEAHTAAIGRPASLRLQAIFRTPAVRPPRIRTL